MNLITRQKGQRMSPKQLKAVLATLKLERIGLQDRIANLRAKLRSELIKEPQTYSIDASRYDQARDTSKVGREL
jgi:hypothetical protein